MSELIKRDQAAIAKTQDHLAMLVNVVKTQNSIAQAAAPKIPIIKPEVLDVEIVEEESQPQMVVQSQSLPDRYAERISSQSIPRRNLRLTRDFVIAGLEELERLIDCGRCRETFITHDVMLRAIECIAEERRTRSQLSDELTRFLNDHNEYYVQWSIDEFLTFMDNIRGEG